MKKTTQTLVGLKWFRFSKFFLAINYLIGKQASKAVRLFYMVFLHNSYTIEVFNNRASFLQQRKTGEHIQNANVIIHFYCICIHFYALI